MNHVYKKKNADITNIKHRKQLSYIISYSGVIIDFGNPGKL